MSAICKICDTVIHHTGFGQHVFGKHGITIRDYFRDYDDDIRCENCNKRIAFYVSRAQTLKKRFCSKKCSGMYQTGDKSFHWKGGALDSGGYKIVTLSFFPKQYHHLIKPMVVNEVQQVREHRGVMAIKLGRPLRDNETVHHLNGIRTDNRPSNLELRIGAHGSGATASALVCPHCGERYDSPVKLELVV